MSDFLHKPVVLAVIFALILISIPLTLVLLKQSQIFKSQALEPSVMCHPAEGHEPYSYTSGAVDVWVLYSDDQGNEIGPMPGVSVHIEKLDNNPGTGPNEPINWSDGPGCGFTADGTTDGSGFTHLEPVNCAHNNFKITVYNLPSNLTYRGASLNNGNLNDVDISQLALANGTTDVVKIYYSPNSTPTPTPTITPTPIITPTPTPTPIPTPTPTPTEIPTPTPTPKPTSTPTPIPTPTPKPTVTGCPIPSAVTNVKITCPVCP